jgi:acetate---CoA ligase (ADP-forming)
MFEPGLGHIQAAPAGSGRGCSSSTRAGSLDAVAADAITDNGMRLSELEPHLKERLRRLLPDYV